MRAGTQGTPARVEYVEELGDHCVVDLKAGDQRIKLKSDSHAVLAEGALTCLSFDPASIHLFDRASGERLN